MVQERRSKTALVTLEYSLYESMRSYAYRNEVSISAYLRSLVVRDLSSKGLLSEDDVMRLAAGA